MNNNNAVAVLEKDNTKLRRRIRQTKEQGEIIKALRKCKKVFAWATVMETHGAYIEVIKGALIKTLQIPLKHGEKCAAYRFDGDSLFLG